VTRWSRSAVAIRSRRIEAIKADDPNRRQVVGLSEALDHRGPQPRWSILPIPSALSSICRGVGHNTFAACFTQFMGAPAGGFVLTEHEAAGKWRA
jgi:hypothetical protein